MHFHLINPPFWISWLLSLTTALPLSGQSYSFRNLDVQLTPDSSGISARKNDSLASFGHFFSADVAGIDVRLPGYRSTTRFSPVEPDSGWTFAGEGHPYTIHRRHEIPVLATGSALSGISLFTRRHELPLTAQMVGALRASAVWRFDRSATRQRAAWAATASNGLVLSAAAAPLLYLIHEKTRKDFGRILLMQAETGLINYGLISLTKSLINRPRPYTYNAAVLLDTKLTRFARESFFSGHVATAASMTFFTATTFSHYYPDSKWKPLVWTYAIVWPAATGYFRYAAGKHFPTDILVGYVVGAATGWLVPRIHQQLTHPKAAKIRRND